MTGKEMGSCYASNNMLPWSTDQMKITLYATIMIRYG